MIGSKILRRLDYAHTLQSPFVVLLLEPCVNAANQARPDTLTLCLISLALYLCVAAWDFWVGLVAMLAVETHAVSLLAWFYIATFVCALGASPGLRQDHWWRRLVSLGCGALVGMVYYGVVHWAHIDRFRTVVHVNTDFEGKVINNFLFECFFLTQHW